ncbi:hypothetical protein H4R19_006755 [Coemansia spiralis]|nr:hypothetical protein H4R19_006755 [Coemansia spiralis]
MPRVCCVADGVLGTGCNCSDESDGEQSEGSDEDIDIDARGVLDALMEAIGAGEPAHVAQEGHADTSTSMEEAMAAMDRELAATHIGRSFDRHGPGAAADDMSEVNVDLNLVRNIVESLRAQEGLPGPAGTLLGQAGIRLPPPGDDDDSEHEDGPGDAR